MKGILDGYLRLPRSIIFGILTILTVGLGLGGTLMTSGCTSSQTSMKLLISVNDAQDAAAQTYTAAVALETQAEATCAAALKAVGKPAPTNAAAIVSTCAAVNVTIPYEPTALQKAAGPINALYGAVRAAQAATNGGTVPTPASTLTALGSTFLTTIADLTAAGVKVPTVLQTVATQLGGTP